MRREKGVGGGEFERVITPSRVPKKSYLIEFEYKPCLFNLVFSEITQHFTYETTIRKNMAMKTEV